MTLINFFVFSVFLLFVLFFFLLKYRYRSFPDGVYDQSRKDFMSYEETIGKDVNVAKYFPIEYCKERIKDIIEQSHEIEEVFIGTVFELILFLKSIFLFVCFYVCSMYTRFCFM